MAVITGKYSSATAYSVTLSSMTIGTVYAILIQDLNSDGSSNGYDCVWKSGATNSTVTLNRTATSTFSKYPRKIGFFQGTFNTSVGTHITDAQFNSWADGTGTISAWGGGGSTGYVLQVGSDGWPSILSSVYFADNTSITQNNQSCSFANTKYIRAISLTSSGLAWSGTIYWSSSSGGTTYRIADITNGSISYDESIEPIDFKNKSRTIYFTAIGQTTRYYRIHAHANGGSFDGDGNEAVWNSGLLKETTEETTIYYPVSNIPTPYRSGYAFKGWGDSATATSVYSSSINIYVGDSSASKPKDKDVYAVWKEKPKTFKFKLSPTNKGVSAYYVYVNDSQKIASTSTNESTITAYDDDTIRISVAMKGIYDNGTLVNGNGFNAPLITAYADSSSYNNVSEYMTIDSNYPGSVSSIPRYKDYSFYAGNRPNHHTFAIGATDKKYNYKIDANEGTWPSGSNPRTGTISSMFKLDLSQFKPTRTGAYFHIGWNTMSALNPSNAYPLNGSIYLTGNLTLYAVWAARYWIIFHANGGKWSNRASDVKPCEAYYTKIIRLGEKNAGDIQNLSRGGHTLQGWSDSSTTVVKYQPGEQFECPLRTKDLDMYAIWGKKSIDKFYWYNNDKQDDTYIAEGKPITNLKASAWNRLKDKIEEVSEATGITLPDTYDPTRVDPTTPISATDYNGVRLAIVNFPGSGTGPAVAKKDMPIGASMFVGTTSLKGAINRAIDQWNKRDT